MDLRIDGISVVEEIGSGNSANVYRARQPKLGRDVAVKVLRTRNPGLLRRFEREAKALGRLSRHPQIVTLYELGKTDDGHPYLVLALCGESLLDRIQDDGPIEWREACGILRAVASGVAAAHEADIVHRDLKPANILTDRDGNPLIADFGISVVVGSSPSRTARVGLTPGYAAPETFQGVGGGDKPADVYALGATLFHLLTGRVPFSSADGDPDLSALMERISIDPVPDIRSDGTPDEVAELVERLLDKKPERRPSAIELHRELSDLLGIEPDVGPASNITPGSGAAPVSGSAPLLGGGEERHADAAEDDQLPALGLDRRPEDDAWDEVSGAEQELPFHVDDTDEEEFDQGRTRVRRTAVLVAAASAVLLAIAAATSFSNDDVGDVGAGSDDPAIDGSNEASNQAESGSDDGTGFDRFDRRSGIGTVEDGDDNGDGGGNGNGSDDPAGPTTNGDGLTSTASGSTGGSTADGSTGDGATGDGATGESASTTPSSTRASAGSRPRSVTTPDGSVSTTSSRPETSSGPSTTDSPGATSTESPRTPSTTTTLVSTTASTVSSTTGSTALAPPRLTITGDASVACGGTATYTAAADREVSGWSWTASNSGIKISPTSAGDRATIEFDADPGFHELKVSAGGSSTTRRIEVAAGDRCQSPTAAAIAGPRSVGCETVRVYRIDGDPESVRWSSPDLSLPETRNGTTIQIQFDVPPGSYLLVATVDGRDTSVTIRVRGGCGPQGGN